MLAAGAQTAADRTAAVDQPQGGLGWRRAAVTEVEAEGSLQVQAVVMVGLITEATQQETKANMTCFELNSMKFFLHIDK